MNTRFLVHTILAVASLASFNASAADLKEVYERAITSDPLIREADANRLAARESKPQAIAALLPQIEGAGRYNDTESDGTSVDINPPNPPAPFDRLTEGNDTTLGPDPAPERVPLGELGHAAARGFRAGPGGGRLSRGAAGPDPAHVGSVLQRARRAGHARSRAGRARRDRAPARAIRKALRSGTHRGHGRPGRKGGVRFRDGRADPGQAQSRDHRRDPARADRRRLRRTREAGQRHAACGTESGQRRGLGEACDGAECAPDLEPTRGRRRAAQHQHRARRPLPEHRFPGSKSWFESESAIHRHGRPAKGDSDFEDTVYRRPADGPDLLRRRQRPPASARRSTGTSRPASGSNARRAKQNARHGTPTSASIPKSRACSR